MVAKAKKSWDWKGGEEAQSRHPFNPHFEASASEQGVSYMVETQGPFCGCDPCGSQTWDELFANGPPDDIEMPAAIELEIREFGLALRR